MGRTMITGLVGLLGLGGITAASMATSKNPERPRAANSAGSEREVDQGHLEREVQALRHEVAALRSARMPTELPSASPAAVAPAPPPPAHRRPSAEDLERIRAQNEAEIAALASRIDAEPRDPSWSRSAEQRLSEAFRAGATPGTQLVSVDCHTTMCGVTFQHEDPQGPRTVPHLVGAALSYGAEMVYSYSADGSETTVYISREGRHLAER